MTTSPPTVRFESTSQEVVTFTGRLAHVSRKQALRLIHRSHSRLSPRLTRQTTLLVVGDYRPPLDRKGRPKKAIRLAQRWQNCGHAITILTERQWLHLLGIAEDREHALHTAGDVAEIVGVTADSVRRWSEAGFLRPARRVSGVEFYDFRQVATVKLLSRLSHAGVSSGQLRKSLRQLKRWVPDATSAIASLDYAAGLLQIRRPDGRLANVAGQLLMEFGDMRDSSPNGQRQATVSVQPEVDWFSAGQSAEERGDHAVAVDAYHRHLLQHPTDVAACFNLGNCLSACGRYEAAVERYWQALEIDSENADFWNNLGDALAELEETEESLECWSRALEIDSSHGPALYNMADTLQTAGLRAAAAICWRRYLELDSTSNYADYARACLRAETG